MVHNGMDLLDIVVPLPLVRSKSVFYTMGFPWVNHCFVRIHVACLKSLWVQISIYQLSYPLRE